MFFAEIVKLLNEMLFSFKCQSIRVSSTLILDKLCKFLKLKRRFIDRYFSSQVHNLIHKAYLKYFKGNDNELLKQVYRAKELSLS